MRPHTRTGACESVSVSVSVPVSVFVRASLLVYVCAHVRVRADNIYAHIR